MGWATSASTRTLRFCIVATATVCAVFFTNDTASARRHGRHRTRHYQEATYSPPFSSIIVDGNSGAILQSNNADGLRHPASLTKIMTLYMLFERLESGRMTLDTQMDVSERAAEQAPTKLGLHPGQSIRVEDAIKALVTRSANDAAVVISEAVAGDEDEFAKLMTRKARALGMSHTTYKNASGLPDDGQVTTARDQAILGRAIQDRFSLYYRYFSTASFNYRGVAIRNHNRLLGQVEGVDGIKTGYTRASGFNLVTSMHRGNRYLIGVVLGGRSGGSRDATMRSLLAQNLERGATKRTVAAITERNPATYRIASADVAEAPELTATSAADANPAVAPGTNQVQGTSQNSASASDKKKGIPIPTPKPLAAMVALQTPAKPDARPETRAEATAVPVPLTSGVISQQGTIIPGSSEPMTPVRVKTLQIKAGQTHAASAPATQNAIPLASIGSAPSTRGENVEMLAAASKANDGAVNTKTEELPQSEAGHGTLNTLPATALQQHAKAMAYAEPTALPTESSGGNQATLATPPAAQQHTPTKAMIHSGWIIQVGALDSESEAKQRLEVARGSARSLLGKAAPFTEVFVSKTGKNLYRARFAGLDKDSAEAACRALKRSDISCITIRN